MSKIVGLTGGIGSGKSTVARVFEQLNCAVYYSDERAKAAYFFEDVKPKVIQLLGKEAYLTDTTINKSFISSAIFSDANLLAQLNAILHPAVIADFKLFANEHATSNLIIKETALLFEAHLENQVDVIVLVTAPQALRVKRVMQRDGLSEDIILKKMKAQLSEEEKIKRSQFIITNDEEQMLLPQVIRVYQQLMA